MLLPFEIKINELKETFSISLNGIPYTATRAAEAAGATHQSCNRIR